MIAILFLEIYKMLAFFAHARPLPLYYVVCIICQCPYYSALSRTDVKSSLFTYVLFPSLICLLWKSDGELSDLKDPSSSLLKTSGFHVWKFCVNESTVRVMAAHVPDCGPHLVPNIQRDSRVTFSKIAVKFLKWFPDSWVE